MRRQRVLLTLAAVIVGVVLLQEPADADCSGPTLDYETGEFIAGEQLRVDGSSFGLQCYDTGPPPDGEGVLGPPIEGIEILVVQGDREWVVATGDADDDYSFAVDITLPTDLAPGEASINARFETDWQPYIRTTAPLIITDDPPLVDEWVVATFGPTDPLPTDGATEIIESTTSTTSTTSTVAPTDAETPPADSGEGDDDDDSGRAGLIAIGMVVVAAAVGGLLLLSKR